MSDLTFAVITKVPDPKHSDGNLASVVLYADGGGFHPLAAQIALSGRIPVFTLGEVLILNADGREPFGEGRKPNKWDVSYEDFSTIEEAIVRARDITP